MTTHWGYVLLIILLGPVAIGLVTYMIVSEWRCWRGTRQWLRTQFPDQFHRATIYGPADPGRVNGPNAKQNVRH